jgi:hypothetical protein
LRALRANRVFSADEKRIRAKNTVLDKSECRLGLYPRSLIAHGRLFVRAQSAIRADGTPSAQAPAQQFAVSPGIRRSG